MSKKNRQQQRYIGSGGGQIATPRKVVSSLLDEMQDGREYASLVGVAVQNLDMAAEIKRAIADIQTVRQRPLLIYAANTVKQQPDVMISIMNADDLPFSEMIAAVPAEKEAIDLLIVTPGGSGQQVSAFVGRMRPRFKDVGIIIPSVAMSAGTIWAVSGNEIWMDRRAFIGPIDPQVPGKDGRLLPAQALVALVEDIKERGNELLKKGQNPSWTDVQILRNIDPKELGNVMTSSQYSIQLASNYLENYKFRDWVTHSNGQPVTPAERHNRAIEVAQKLCSHTIWKTHSHGISREVAWQELKIKIGHPETVPGFDRAIRRLWALLYWGFENSNMTKMFFSDTYALFRSQSRVNP